MGERQCVAILGGGIRGASIAGMLAATGNFDVVVVERQEVAAGTTSTNHGRFHSGTWNYTENNEIIIRRNQDSCRLLRMLPDVIASNDTGYYFIESVEAIEPFKQFCHKHSIPITQHLPTDVNCDWIEPQI